MGTNTSASTSSTTSRITIGRLRTRLPAMLTEAEGGHLVPQLDSELIGRVVDEVQRIAEQAQQARRTRDA